MSFETIRWEKSGPSGVITFDRPECLNAVNAPLRKEFHAILTECLDDFDTRVLVLTGSGRGFCSGLDLKDQTLVKPGGLAPKDAYEAQRTFSELILLMRRIPHPIIGAINGAACGAGFSFAMATDIRLAVPKAKFQASYINLGVGGADMGSSWLLPRAIGMGNAARYLMTGDFMMADDALRLGFVQSIVEPDQLMDNAMKLAKKLANKSPLGLRVTKEALECNAAGVSLEAAIRMEDRNQAMCIAQLSAK